MSVSASPAPQRHRSGSHVQSSWGGLSSLLRLAASDRRSAGSRSVWWSGMARALRAAGSDPQSRPLHAVLAGGDCLSGRD